MTLVNDLDNVPSNITVTGVSDNTAPQIESVSFSTTNVDTCKASTRTIDVSFNNLTDDISGIDYAYINYQSPSGNNSIGSSGWVSATEVLSKSSLVAEMQFKEYAEAGDWTFNYMYVYDKAGNYKYYYRNDLDNVPSNITLRDGTANTNIIDDVNENKLSGTPLTGSIAQGIKYDIYEGTGGSTAIEDLNLIDTSGDNTIIATNDIETERYYNSYTVNNSNLETGDGDDSITIKNYKGYYSIGLKNSKLKTGGGKDTITINMLEDDFFYGSYGLEDSEIETGSGDDKVSLTLTSSRNDTFTSYAVKNSSIKLGTGDDELNIDQKNSSGNLDIAISGSASGSVIYDLGDGDDIVKFKSEGYGVKSNVNDKHSIYLGNGNDQLTIESTYSAFEKANLFAGDGDDVIKLVSSKEFHYGIKDSKLYLEEGDDVITINSSNNSSIDGGRGKDIVKISDNYISYNVETKSNGSGTITKNDDGFFKLTLNEIEQLIFNDKTFYITSTSDIDENILSITGPSGSAGDPTSSKAIVENKTNVHIFESNDFVTWSLSGGSDESLFNIDSSTGALTFISPPDYESPTDSDKDNSYVVNITATDYFCNSVEQALTVSVADIDELASTPIYSLYTDINVPQENYLLTTTAQTSNVAVGTKIYWSLSGKNINLSDFSSGAMNGEGTVDSNGSFSFQHFIANDGVTEGYETIDIKLFSDVALTNQLVTTKSIIIRDSAIQEQIAELDSELSTLKSLLTVGQEYTLSNIRDYDGNLHASTSTFSSSVTSAYKYQGLIDVNNDSVTDAIYTNKASGRWVTASVDSVTGLTDYSDYGKDGTTRVVGLYIDPLVTSGEVIQGSDHDSQYRFQNDLESDNLLVKTSGDYDGDGFQEVYWKTTDGTAYLRALMHTDGNIQYANYQSEAQMTDYLTSNGYESVVSEVV